MRTNSDDSAPKKKRTMNGGGKNNLSKRKAKEGTKKMRKLQAHPYHEGFLSVGGDCSAGEQDLLDGLGSHTRLENGVNSAASEAEDLAEIDEIMEGLMANAGGEEEGSDEVELEHSNSDDKQQPLLLS